MVKRHGFQMTKSVKQIIIGALSAVVMSILITAFMAMAAVKGWIPQTSIRYVIPVIAGISCFMGSLISLTGFDGKYIVVCAITCVSYLFISLLTAFIVFDGVQGDVNGVLISAIAGCAIACAMALKKGDRKSRKNHRY